MIVPEDSGGKRIGRKRLTAWRVIVAMLEKKCGRESWGLEGVVS